MINLAVALLFFSCGVKSDEDSCSPSAFNHDTTYGGVEVVFSAMNCSHFPVRELPLNVTTLYFDRNKIQTLKTEFLRLANLRYLDLSINSISHIQKNAFKGLSRLDVLRLDGNKDLDIDYTEVFEHLNELKVLFLNGTGVSVSGGQISRVISLQALYVDCQKCEFNKNFVNLSSFSNLTIRSGRMRNLKNSTFVYVPHLQALSLVFCNIEHIDAGAFKPLKNLIFLDLSSNRELGLTGLEKGLYGLRYSPVLCLRINYVTPLGNIVPLLKSAFQYIANTSLKELHFDGNAITYISKGATETLPKTLQVLSIRNTVIGQFDITVWMELLLLPSLKSLDITGAEHWVPENGGSLPWYYTHLPHFAPFPPKLEFLKFSSRKFRTDFKELILHPKNVLKKVIGSNNLIMSLTGPNTGADSVTYLDLSRNKINKFASNFSSNRNCLKYLNLSENILGKKFEADRNGDIFVNARNVEVLDISNNRITSLPVSFFRGLRKIQYLNISNNVLFMFRVSLNHMIDLQHLDLSNNRLQLLHLDIQKDLDVLKNTVINLEGNPIICSCQTLQFFQWVTIQHERIQGLTDMTCRLPNGTRVTLKNIDDVVSQLKQQCSSNVILMSVSISSALCILVVIGVIAVYRNRWKLRYLYHVGRRGYRVQDDNEYQYNVFVSYAQEDRDFVINKILTEIENKAGLKLCIHERDFLGGSSVTGNIVAAIQNSRKTLIVLSPNFLESEMCVYEFNMALVDGLRRKQNTILVVMYTQVELRNVPKDLAVMLSNNSYLEYNTDVHGEVVFWDNVVRSINTLQPLH